MDNGYCFCLFDIRFVYHVETLYMLSLYNYVNIYVKLTMNEFAIKTSTKQNILRWTIPIENVYVFVASANMFNIYLVSATVLTGAGSQWPW